MDRFSFVGEVQFVLIARCCLLEKWLGGRSMSSELWWFDLPSHVFHEIRAGWTTGWISWA